MDDRETAGGPVLEAFSDPLAREVLAVASAEQVTAAELAAELDVALSTVYRRTNRLEDCGLLDVHRRLGDDGNHYRVFETALRRVVVEFEDGECAVDATTRDGLVDRFEAFWADFESSSSPERSSERDEAAGEPVRGDPT